MNLNLSTKSCLDESNRENRSEKSHTIQRIAYRIADSNSFKVEDPESHFEESIRP